MTDTQKETILDRLKVLLPDEDDADLLGTLIDDAEAQALAYMNRTELPSSLLKQVGDLALIAYNRRGTEGESGRSEGGESYSFETSPEQIYGVLAQYRLARVGGKIYETAETDEN